MASAEEFVKAVKEFCSWAESEPCGEEKEVKTAITLLANLYSKALPITIGTPNFDIDAKRISNERWKEILTRFGSFPFKYYRVVFDPSHIDTEEPVVGDIADDMADIYRDLSAGLSLYESGHKVEAVWEWKQNFNSHWGRHVTSALYALHAHASSNDIEL